MAFSSETMEKAEENALTELNDEELGYISGGLTEEHWELVKEKARQLVHNRLLTREQYYELCYYASTLSEAEYNEWAKEFAKSHDFSAEEISYE